MSETGNRKISFQGTGIEPTESFPRTRVNFAAAKPKRGAKNGLDLSKLEGGRHNPLETR